MRKLILILCLTIFCLGCRTPRPTVSTNVSRTDSTSTKITYKKQLDTITVEADSLKIAVPIADLSETPIYVKSKSGRTSGSIRKVNGTVECECFTERYEKIIETQSKLIETLIKQLEVKETTITKVEYKTPWYSKALSLVGSLVLLFFVLKFGSKFIKF